MVIEDDRLLHPCVTQGGSSFDLVEQPRNGNRLRTMCVESSGFGRFEVRIVERIDTKPELPCLRLREMLLVQVAA